MNTQSTRWYSIRTETGTFDLQPLAATNDAQSVLMREGPQQFRSISRQDAAATLRYFRSHGQVSIVRVA